DGLSCRAWAISAPFQRCRRRCATQLTSSGGVAPGLRRGRHERSAKPAAASAAYRASHLRTVRSLTPTAAATAAGASCWLRTRSTIRPRLRGVVRAFLWMFIRASSSAGMVGRQPPTSQRRPGWTISWQFKPRRAGRRGASATSGLAARVWRRGPKSTILPGRMPRMAHGSKHSRSRSNRGFLMTRLALPARLTAALATVCLLLAGAGVAASQPRAGGSLSIVQGAEPATLVSGVNTSTFIGTVSTKIHEGLLDYDFDLKPRAALAESWTVAPDGKTYTFKLRRGVTWHDGKPFTSADVKFSLEEVWKKLHPRGRVTFAKV